MVHKELEGTGWECLSNEYKNLKTLMTFKCPFGHQVEESWEVMRRDNRYCPICHSQLKLPTVIAKSKSNEKVLRILALDQATYKTGWSVYDDEQLVEYGVFETQERESLSRIVLVCDWLSEMIEKWQPDLIGIEDIQYNPTSGHNTFKMLGQLMGGVMLTIAQRSCSIEVIPIMSWKHGCGIAGRKREEQKQNAQLLVKREYGVTATEDESDAICIGRYLSSKYTDHALVKKKGIGEY